MVFHFNRKGQIDKIITFLPVFILIFLLIAGFIVFSALISKSGRGFGDASSVTDGGFIFENVQTKIENQVVNLRVIDATSILIGSLKSGKSSENDFSMFYNHLIPLLSGEGNCLAFFYSKSLSNYVFKYDKLGTFCSSLEPGVSLTGCQNAKYRANKININEFGEENLNTITLSDNEYIKYYYGRCLE